jgi:competence ComEA-like helix-hairpin-helix protein
MSKPHCVDVAPQKSVLLLRRRDQQLLAGLAVIAGLALLGWWQRSGGLSDRLIEWDRMTGHSAHFEVNINTASWPELTQLPEIGETLARRIVENRRAEGPFEGPENLTRVHGIGDKTLDHMRPYLRPESWLPNDSPGAPFDSSPPQRSEG